MTGGMRHDPEHQREKVSGLIERYRRGEISTAVFGASLHAIGIRPEEIRYKLSENYGAFANSIPHKRGDVS